MPDTIRDYLADDSWQERFDAHVVEEGAKIARQRRVSDLKLESLEDRCEDYGQIARYRASVNGYPNAFPLDDHHRFEKDKPVPVCGNTAAMLSETRLAVHFDVTGGRSTHFGLFDCGDGPASSDRDGLSSCC